MVCETYRNETWEQVIMRLRTSETLHPPEKRLILDAI